MGTVHRLKLGRDIPQLADAVAAFLTEVDDLHTHRVYRTALTALLAEVGETRLITVLDDETTAVRIGTWFGRRWGAAAPSTVTARLDALRSAATWWRRHGWISRDPLRRVPHASSVPDRIRTFDQPMFENMLARLHVPLRERTLWWMLSESAARAEDVLALDVTHLDLRCRRAQVRRNSGVCVVFGWRADTARLLPQLLGERDSGPVFLTNHPSRGETTSATAPTPATTRLSYRRAAQLFEQATIGLPDGPFTLHHLRQAALANRSAADTDLTTAPTSFSSTSAVTLASFT